VPPLLVKAARRHCSIGAGRLYIGDALLGQAASARVDLQVGDATAPAWVKATWARVRVVVRAGRTARGCGARFREYHRLRNEPCGTRTRDNLLKRNPVQTKLLDSKGHNRWYLGVRLDTRGGSRQGSERSGESEHLLLRVRRPGRCRRPMRAYPQSL